MYFPHRLLFVTKLIKRVKRKFNCLHLLFLPSLLALSRPHHWNPRPHHWNPTYLEGHCFPRGTPQSLIGFDFFAVFKMHCNLFWKNLPLSIILDWISLYNSNDFSSFSFWVLLTYLCFLGFCPGPSSYLCSIPMGDLTNLIAVVFA